VSALGTTLLYTAVAASETCMLALIVTASQCVC